MLCRGDVACVCAGLHLVSFAKLFVCEISFKLDVSGWAVCVCAARAAHGYLLHTRACICAAFQTSARAPEKNVHDAFAICTRQERTFRPFRVHVCAAALRCRVLCARSPPSDTLRTRVRRAADQLLIFQ